MKLLKKTFQNTFITVAFILGSPVSQAASTLEPSWIKMALQTAYYKYKNNKEGANADYIPILAKVDSNIFLIRKDRQPNTENPLKLNLRQLAINNPPF
ncbi:MAG: hypothetical protein V3U87_05120 [Methylococcaceae bacterium]